MCVLTFCFVLPGQPLKREMKHCDCGKGAGAGFVSKVLKGYLIMLLILFCFLVSCCAKVGKERKVFFTFCRVRRMLSYFLLRESWEREESFYSDVFPLFLRSASSLLVTLAQARTFGGARRKKKINHVYNSQLLSFNSSYPFF